MNNRALWEREGNEIVAQMLEQVEKEYGIKEENDDDIAAEMSAEKFEDEVIDKMDNKIKLEEVEKQERAPDLPLGYKNEVWV